MTTNTKEKIITLLREQGRLSAKQLQQQLGISRQALFVHLAALRQQGKLDKEGLPPRVLYSLSKITTPWQLASAELDLETAAFIEDRYLYINPLGERHDGLLGFSLWCYKTKQDLRKTASEYVKTQRRYDRLFQHGLVNGLPKLRSTFEQVYLDDLFYLDFYSIERFGKTKLGQLLLYAKQSQNRKIIAELVDLIRPRLLSLLAAQNFSSVGFIPATVKRELQLMTELARGLALPLRPVRLTKLRAELVVPQKTLSRLEDRVENAARTLMIEETVVHDDILLIDDAVGSGATLNETARQLKDKGLVRGRVVGLALVGSFKGFDVISEV